MPNKRITDLTETSSLSDNDYFAIDDSLSTTRKISFQNFGAAILLTTALVNALAAKQDTLTFDDVPTDLSSNPVKSGGVYSALAGKQNVLTFDDVPTAGSDNPVKSGGIYNAIGTVATSLDSVVGNMATVEASPALSAHAVGEYLIYNDTLFVVTSAIAVGDNITPGTNVSAVTIGDQVKEINDSIDTIETKLDGIEAGAEVNIIEDVKVNGTSLPVTNKSVNVPVPTKMSELTGETESVSSSEQFIYRQSPADFDALATIKKIKGKSLVWNQLVQNGNFADTSYWRTRSGCTITVSNNIGTISFNAEALSSVRNTSVIPITNHKYLISGECKTSANQNVLVGFTNNGGTPRNPQQIVGLSSLWTHFSFSDYFTDTTGEGDVNGLMFRSTNTDTSYSIDVRNVMCIDLTQMFGSGNEPSTVEEFTELFPLPYYDYNTGELLSFKGSGLKSTGKNLLEHSLSSATVNGVTFTVNQDKSVTVSGTATATTGVDIITNLKNGDYIFSGIEGAGRAQIRTYPGDVFVTDVNGDTPYTISNNEQVIFRLRVASGVTANWTVYPMVRFANVSDSTYEPYTEHTKSLPVSTYFPTGMKSAGSVYDEMTEEKAITRVGAVDLGTLDYGRIETTVSNRYRYDASIPDSVPVSDSINGIRSICSRLSILEQGGTYQANADGYTIYNNRIYIYLDAYSQATLEQFKAFISGVMLYYELATSTEVDINIDLDYAIENGGTEKLLPDNTSAPTTSPLLADIIYDELVSYNNLKKLLAKKDDTNFFYIDEEGYGCINYDLFE